MRTLVLLLSVAAVSLVTILAASTDSLYSANATSAQSVIQSQSASGALEYRSVIEISTIQMFTVNQQIDAFKQEHLEGNGLPINEKKQTIKGSDGKNITFDYKVTCNIQPTDSGTVFLQINFANFYSYAKYNGLDLKSSKGERSLFFVEYETEFNAYTRFFDVNGQSKKTATIISEFNQKFDLSASKKPEYIYVLANSQRRTKTNADVTNEEFGVYTYYFKVSDDLTSLVKIFDRRPNTTIWYVAAIGATAVAMGAFYIIMKTKRQRYKPNGNNPNVDIRS